MFGNIYNLTNYIQILFQTSHMQPTLYNTSWLSKTTAPVLHNHKKCLVTATVKVSIQLAKANPLKHYFYSRLNCVKESALALSEASCQSKIMFLNDQSIQTEITYPPYLIIGTDLF